MEIKHSREREMTVLKETVPSMVFEPGRESLQKWQERASGKLRELLCLPRTECAREFNIEFTEKHEGFTEIRFTFQSEEGEYAPCHIWIPEAEENEKPPVMICLQGHSTGMHISMGRAKFEGDAETANDGDRDFMKHCIERGMAAVCLEQRCFGERGGNPNPDCYFSAMTALLSGRTLLGGRVWDIMKLIDVLEENFADFVDVNKVYCMGNSGGGTATFYSTALDKRIKAAIPSCAFATFSGSIGAMYHCACNYVPGIAKYFDMAEIAGLIAPRPLVIVSGKEDKIFPLPTAEHEFTRLKEIYYKNSVCPDNCIHVKGDGGHRFYAEPAYEEFGKMVK